MLKLDEIIFWENFIRGTKYDTNLTITKDIRNFLEKTVTEEVHVTSGLTSNGLFVSLPPKYETLFRIKYAEYIL